MLDKIIELVDKPDFLWTIQDYAIWYGFIAVCGVAVILICIGISWAVAKILDRKKKRDK